MCVYILMWFCQLCITVVLCPWAEHKSAKEGGGAVTSVSTFNHERASMYVYSDSIPSKQITIFDSK